MASWKRYEREIAKILGGKRIPILGREGADIDVNNLWVDCKKRQQVPKQWEDMVSAAETLGLHGFIFFESGRGGIVAARLDHFAHTPKQPWVAQAFIKPSQLPIAWLDHIKESCPDDHLPIVIMVKTGRPYRESIVVFEFEQYIRWYSDTHQSITPGASHSESTGRASR